MLLSRLSREEGARRCPDPQKGYPSGPETIRVEYPPAIHDCWRPHELLELTRLQGLELLPAGRDDAHVGSRDTLLGGSSVGDLVSQKRPGVACRFWVVGHHPRALVEKGPDHPDGSGLSDVVRAGFE